MDDHLSHEVRDALTQGTRRSRLRIVSDGDVIPLRRRWESGFSVDAERSERLRGRVDLYDGEALMGRGLIAHVATERGERYFEFKQFSRPDDGPPVDFERPAAVKGPEIDPEALVTGSMASPHRPARSRG